MYFLPFKKKLVRDLLYTKDEYQCFPLVSYDITKESDSHIMLLIRRMTNLKELRLPIIVYRLQNEMLIYLSQLQILTIDQ